MDTNKAYALRKQFLKDPFVHIRNLVKETILGVHTGDMVCTICGIDSREINSKKEKDPWCKFPEPE